MLKDAVIKANQYDIHSLPTDVQINHEFSLEFQEKIQELICQSKEINTKRFTIWRRKMAIGIGIILVHLLFKETPKLLKFLFFNIIRFI
jgi:hypothetical protein